MSPFVHVAGRDTFGTEIKHLAAACTWALLPEVGAAYTPMQNFRTMDSRLFHVGVAATSTR